MVTAASMILLSAATVGASDDAWVRFEQAEEHAMNGRPARALQLYAEALEARPNYPEAMVGMARIYDQEGDRILAERYYRLALDMAGQLDVPDEEYLIRFELADHYDRYGETSEYRNQLLTIIARDPVFNNRDGIGQRGAMRSVLMERGIDRVLVLYRLSFPQALAAHRTYASWLVSTSPSPDNLSVAVDHYLFAVVEVAGRAVEAIIDRRFDFQYATLDNLLTTANRYPEVDSYLERVGFESLLREFADALARLDDPAGAVRATEILAQLP